MSESIMFKIGEFAGNCTGLFIDAGDAMTNVGVDPTGAAIVVGAAVVTTGVVLATPSILAAAGVTTTAATATGVSTTVTLAGTKIWIGTLYTGFIANHPWVSAIMLGTLF